jgi:hypothetical protein
VKTAGVQFQDESANAIPDLGMQGRSKKTALADIISVGQCRKFSMGQLIRISLRAK